MEQWFDEEPIPGVLEICYMSGAHFCFLVVNGPAYGTVWEYALRFFPGRLVSNGPDFRRVVSAMDKRNKP